MKTIWIILGVVIIGGGIWYVSKPKPDASVPTAVVSDVSTTTDTSTTKPTENTTQATGVKQIDNANVKISFKGFGPDKVHNGTFGKVNSKLAFNATGDLSGEVVVDMTTLVADNTDKLTPHLKSADFFDVVKYPTATFKVTSFKDSKVSGVMTIHGVSKTVSFSDVIIEQIRPAQYKAKFNIDMKEFGIVQKFANEVVEVTVTVPLK
jgi:polyisoprenoid-binding protein YceI